MDHLETFTEKVIAIVVQIPIGKVMTFGQIASLAGSPRGARQVVRILHSMSKKYKLPWHRVVNAKGEISLKDEELFNTQKIALENEGIQFIDDSVNLAVYRYDPNLNL